MYCSLKNEYSQLEVINKVSCQQNTQKHSLKSFWVLELKNELDELLSSLLKLTWCQEPKGGHP